MSRWFRHYAGMMRDEKLVRAAMHSKQSVERVCWVWGAILESASEINDGGRYEIDPMEVAYFLRCDEADVVGIVVALESLARVNKNVVVAWADRQFESDTSRERQKRYRDRQKSSLPRNGDVTPPSRDGQVTLQETETDTKTERKKKEGRSQATRLPADWMIPNDWLLEATAAGMFREAALASANRMHNWSLSDPKGKKLDWRAAWRNWFQRDLPKPPSTASPAPRNAGERAFLKLQGQSHEPPDTAPKRMEAGDGRRQIEGYGDAGAFAGAQGSFGRN
jgi:hypothetical protein